MESINHKRNNTSSGADEDDFERFYIGDTVNVVAYSSMAIGQVLMFLRCSGCETKGFIEFPLGSITLDEFMNINPDQQHNVTSLQAYFSRLGRPRFACECSAIEYVTQLRQRPWRLAAKN